MSCRVLRNKNNQITKVQDEDGNEIPVFVHIASHPLIGDTDTALNVYKNTFLPRIGADAIWQHKVGDMFTTSYKEALDNAKQGEPIEVGFTNNKGKFFKIISATKNTNKDTIEGFLNFSIESGIMSDTKVFIKDGYRFTAMGNNPLIKAINTEILDQDATRFLGKEGVQRDEDSFYLDKTNGTVRIENNKGEYERVKYDELDNMPYEEVRAKFENPEFIMLEREMYKSQAAYRDTTFENNVPTFSEKELQQALLNLLSKMGVKTLSISDYVSKYETKNGIAPSATALADIANQVVAYSRGEISLGDLTEETSHFIVEAMPIEQTENVLRNIHRTEEWVQYSDQYRELYRKDFSGEELEDAVRREVLGKVLKNSIAIGFDTNNKTSIQSSIISKVKELLDNFFNTIRDFFKPSYKTELDAYIKDVNIIVRNQDISSLDLSQFKHNKYRLYSTDGVPEVDKTIGKLISGLELQVKTLSKESATSSLDRNKLRKAKEDIQDFTASRADRTLNKAEEALANAKALSAVSTVTGMATKSINYLNNAILDSEKNDKSYVFSNEETVVYGVLKNLVSGSLKELQVLTTESSLRSSNILGETESYKRWGVVNKGIDEALRKLNVLEGKVSLKQDQNINRIVDTVMSQYDFPPGTRDNLMKWAKAAESDTNFAHATFGSLAHSKDGSLRLLGYLLRKVHTEASTNYTLATQKLQKELRDLGYDEKFFKDVMFDGDQILNPFNLPLVNEVMEEMYADAYRKEMGSDMSTADITKAKNKGTLELSREQQVRIDQQFRRDSQILRERPMTDEYYKEYEKKIDKANLADISKVVIADYLTAVSKLKRKATQPDGTIDYSTLSNTERQELKDITEQRQLDKNIYDATGELKDGLVFDRDSDGAIKKGENGKPIVTLGDNPSPEAQVAFDINKLDDVFREENKKRGGELKGMPIKFLEQIDHIQNTANRAEAYDFLISNSYIAMSSDFWDRVSMSNNNETILDRLRPVDVELYNDIIQQRDVVKNILKQNTSKNLPSEVDGASMSSVSKASIKQAQENLDQLYKKARKILPKQERAESPDRPGAEQLANESYQSELEARNINNAEDEFNFAQDHMTTTNKDRVQASIVNINGAIKNTLKLEKNLATLFDEQYNNNFTREENFELLKRKVIRDALLPYYKTYSPITYKTFFQSLKDPANPNSIRSEIENRSEDIEISPNYSFYTAEDNDMVNKNYDPDFRGGFVQPRKGNIKVGNKTYNFQNPKWAEVENDANKLKAYNLIMDWYKEGLKAMNVDTGYNIYQKPQIRKGTMERLDRTIKDPKRLSLAFKEAFTYTDDDVIQGEKIAGTNVNLIPKRFIYKIEDQKDVSDELFYSMNLLVEQGYLRQARFNAYGDVQSMMDNIQDDQRYNKIDKRAESTNTYKMAKSAVDDAMFAVRESVVYETSILGRKVDLTKFAKKTLGFVKFRNLGANIVIPITSLLTGMVTRKTEAFIGEFIDIRSQRLGAREFAKIVGEGMKDFGKMNTKAKINVLGQYFGAFDINETFKNSNYGFLGRLAPKTGMGLHALSNYPLYGKTLMGILHDFRIVDGKLTRWYDYRNEQRKEGKSLKDVKAEWNKHEDKVIYKFIDVKDGILSFKEKELESQIDNYDKKLMVDRIIGHVHAVNERTDGQMSKFDRNLASRHFLLNFFNTHRQYLSLAMQHRFKSRGVNFNTGKEEEGSYASFFEFSKRYVQAVKDDGFQNILKSFKTAYDSADQIEKDNLKRVGIELTMLNIVFMTALLIRAWADDKEEDPFALKLADLLMARLGNELSSVQLGIGQSAIDAIAEPFVGLNVLTNAADISEAFSGDEIKSGSYKGFTKRRRYLTRLVPGAKSTNDLFQLNQTANTYRFFNENTYNNWYNPLNYFMTKQVISKEDKNK